jgi:1-pyrroline-5-carboxylate dehydrogenase
MTDPLAGLPRVTYANAAADFSGLHAVFDRELPVFAARALGRDHAHRIGDRDDVGGRRYAVASPIDARETLGTLVAGDAAAVDRAVAAARAATSGWRAAGWAARAAALRRVAAVIRRDRLALAMAAVLEVGKSRLEAMGEIEESIDLIEYYCGQVESAHGWERELAPGPGGETGHDRLRPYGVFAVIAPFNYPFALAIGMTTGALLGGNTVVLKPAPGAALSAPALARAFGEAGLPAGVFNLVCGDRETGEAIAAHPGVDGIAFTGSHEVGMRLLRDAVAGRFARPVLAELGGKNAAFVTATADLDAAASGVARSAFGLSGQKCSSCSKVYVQRAVRDAFIDRLRAACARLAVGDPRLAATFTGPVIGEAGARRFESALAAARAAGASVLLGGHRLRDGLAAHGAYLEPTVVADAAPDHEINRHELFLPLLSLQSFDALGAAIDDSNRSPLGLSAGVYARDPEELALFDDRIEAGVLYANRSSGATTGAWPGFQTFCGWKGSGATGKGGLGPHYVQQFMREQSRTRAA